MFPVNVVSPPEGLLFLISMSWLQNTTERVFASAEKSTLDSEQSAIKLIFYRTRKCHGMKEKDPSIKLDAFLSVLPVVRYKTNAPAGAIELHNF